MQFSTPLRNARANLIESMIGPSPVLDIFDTAAPANTTDPDPGTLLCSMNLPSTWESTATTGSIALAGTWSGVAVATGAPLSFRIKDSSAVVWAQGTCSIGAGGDLVFDGSIYTGQTVVVDTFGITEGNA